MHAQVRPPGQWSWPPHHKSLLHTKRALGLEDEPDAHSAWHERNARLVDKAPMIGGLPSVASYLEDIEDHVRQGKEHGWLDSENRAYDRHAYQTLRDAVDQALTPLSDQERQALAAARGDWVGVFSADKPEYWNPLDPEQGHVRTDARRAFQSANEHGDVTLAGEIATAVTDALANWKKTPALPPQGVGEPFREQWYTRLRENFKAKIPGGQSLLGSDLDSDPSVQYTPSPRDEVYYWIASSRLQTDTHANHILDPTRRTRAVAVIQRYGETMGYPRTITEVEAAAILDNGWSPAQVNQAFRRRRRAERRVSQAMSQEGGAYAAGQAFWRALNYGVHTQSVKQPASDDTSLDYEYSAWPGGVTLPDMDFDQRVAFATGAGAPLMKYAHEDAMKAWYRGVTTGREPTLDEIQQGLRPDLVPAPGKAVMAHDLERAGFDLTNLRGLTFTGYDTFVVHRRTPDGERSTSTWRFGVKQDGSLEVEEV